MSALGAVSGSLSRPQPLGAPRLAITRFGLIAGATAAAAGAGYALTRRPGVVKVTASMAPLAGNGLTFSVATWNLRGVSDRWAERRLLLAQALREMDADVVCFQEVLTGEYGQDRGLLDASYHIFPCKAALFNLLSGTNSNVFMQAVARLSRAALEVPVLRSAMVTLPAAVEAWREKHGLQGLAFRTLRDITLLPFFGNSLACRLAEAHEIKHSTLVLGSWRAAQRIEFEIGQGPDRLLVYVVNAHLDHEHPDARQRQAEAVMAWMEGEKRECAAILFCGDFNGNPQEPFHARLRERGYKSAYLSRHGREPPYTWPSGIQAPLMDHGPAECLDYVYVWAAKGFEVRVLDASVHGLKPAPRDRTLFPSDHAAVRATLEVRRTVPAVPPNNDSASGGSRENQRSSL